ncbi:aldo/keto reductase [Ruminococcaceae bacterium OttesenSCG-928-O06]|nr:aldo/keto reductase [Ruminococcaceae bacterium OttesenSCG-928-O06]
MEATLGRTGLTVNKDGFGALPVQRVGMQDAVALLRAAFDGGINFFDTARAYSDSEEKLGNALSAQRTHFTLATKTGATTPEAFRKDLATSLSLLQTDHVDIYQFHNPMFCPLPGDGSGLYEEMGRAKEEGKIRFIGITNHRLNVAQQAIESGAYDTLQFPFSYLSGPQEQALVRLCEEKNMGFIAMKALSGGLITDISAARAWMNQFAGVVPIWGIQKPEELAQLFAAQKAGATLTPAAQQRIEQDRAELAGDFCRGCGYCMPCPAGIDISWCARMSLLLRRAPAAGYFSPLWQEKMEQINGCIQCGQCKKQCPYQLDTPALLRKNYQDYRQLLAAHQGAAQ